MATNADADKTAKRKTELEAEQQKIEARRLARRKQAQADDERANAIYRELANLKVVGLVGVPDAVMLKIRLAAGNKCAHLNHLRGTLTEIKRTWSLVDFGAGGKWRVRLSNLMPSSESDNQGWTVLFGGGK